MSVVLALRERTAARFRRGIDAGVATVCTMDLPQIELVMDRDEARCVVVDPGEVTMEYLARIAVIVERRAGVLLLWSAFQP